MIHMLISCLVLGSALGKPQSPPETDTLPPPAPLLAEMAIQTEPLSPPETGGLSEMALQPEPLATIQPLDGELEPLATIQPLDGELEPLATIQPLDGELEPLATIQPLDEELEPLATIPPLDVEPAAERHGNRSSRYTDCCGRTNRAARIVGGQVTGFGEYPWQAAIVSKGSKTPYCGGSVINDRYVLTAAHCISSARYMQVVLAEHNTAISLDGLRFDVEQAIIHPSYDPRKFYYDFALLKLTSIISFAYNSIAPACLADVGNFAGYPGVVTGWGRLTHGGSSSHLLREVTVDIMSNSDCEAVYGDFIIDASICTIVEGGGKNPCQGDSGGALVTELEADRYLQIGVVSFARGCADDGYPAAYARVSFAYNWIMENTADANYC